MSGNTFTIVGNLTADPELRFTPAGIAVGNFTIAKTDRKFNKDTNTWEDGDTLYISCTVWRDVAENVAESLQKGSRVIAFGSLKPRSFTTTSGEKRTVFELDVEEIGASLKYASAKITKTNKSTGDGAAYASKPPARSNQHPADEPPF